MHSTEIVVARGFHADGRAGLARSLEPTASRGRRAAWMRSVASTLRGLTASDADRPAAAPPRRELPIPFC